MNTYYAYDRDKEQTEDDCGDLGQFEAEDFMAAIKEAARLWPTIANIRVVDAFGDLTAAEFARAVRVAEATQSAAVRAILVDQDNLKRSGSAADRSTAGAYNAAAGRVKEIAPEAIAATVTRTPPNPDERAAFSAAAAKVHFQSEQRANGEYFHPITNRVYAVWRAGVRWAQEYAATPAVVVAQVPAKPGTEPNGPRRRREDVQQTEQLLWDMPAPHSMVSFSPPCEHFAKPRLLRNFIDLPLGARFWYPEHQDRAYVVLERHGCGQVADADPVDVRLQGIYTAADSEAACRDLVVLVDDRANGGQQ